MEPADSPPPRSTGASPLRAPGGILVVSCYELGRQPVAAATALAELTRAGFAPAALDISVERLDEAALRRAALVAISVPMHTALRLGVRVAERARKVNPAAHLCLFGLYASLNQEHLLGRHCDSCIGGEADEPLRLLAEALASGLAPPASAPPGALPRKAAHAAAQPERAGLPVLSHYARLEHQGESRLVASVEASRGCLHLCKHCPIVPVYQGRFVAVPRETVLADIAQQIDAGAGHVTFGDPDFLNGPTHALKLTEELHRRWPEVTFDATIKIEHLLNHRALLPALAQAGCLFITSAVESLSDRVLLALDKGHTAAEVPVALDLVRAAGIDLRPTLLPFTPWSELLDLPALFAFAEQHDLLEQIDPVQYTLRLLLPPGSALLDPPRSALLDPPGSAPLERRGSAPLEKSAAPPWLGSFDPARFTWNWTHPDPRVDALCTQSGALAQQGAETGRDPLETVWALRALAEQAAGLETRLAPPAQAGAARPRRSVPRLTEPWFC